MTTSIDNMENLLNDIKNSPGFKELSENYTEEQLKTFLEQFQAPKENEIDSEGGMTITPTPGFVVKTFDVNAPMKVFINICSHSIIELPEEKELPDQEEEHVGLRVPLSLGTPVQDTDRKGNKCTVYDVIVNPGIVERCQSETSLRQIVIELCIYHIHQKYKQQCSPKFKLPRMKYKGKVVQKQRVRAKKDPKIEIIDKEVFETPQESCKTPEWSITVDGEDLDCENVSVCEAFEIRINLELLVSSKAINLEISPEELVLKVGRIYFLNLWFPFLAGQFSAVFDCAERVLYVRGKVKREVQEGTTETTTTLKPVTLPEHSMLFDVI